MNALCLDQYGDTEIHCTEPLGHTGDHLSPTGDDDGVWAWAATIHHPERTPDTMLLDVVAHADAAMNHPLPMLAGPVGRRLARSLGIG